MKTPKRKSLNTTVIDDYVCPISGKTVIKFAARLRCDNSIIEEAAGPTYEDAWYEARKRTTDLRIEHGFPMLLKQAI